MDVESMYESYLWLRSLDWNEQVAILTEQARAELAKQIADSRNEIEAYIENTTLNRIQKRKAEVLLDEIDEKISEACGTMTELITAAAIGTAEESIKAYGDILSAGGAAKNVRLMDGLSREQIKAVFTDQPLGGRLLSDWVDRAFDSKVSQELRISLNDGIEHGHSTRRIVDAMKAKLPEGYAKAEHEMTTLARTYIQAANTGAQELCYEANKEIIRGFRRVGALDNRTCLTCALMDGKRYYGAQKRPKLPQHPRCRCIYLPILPSFKEMGLDIPEFEDEARHWAIREDGSIGTGGKKIIKHGTIRGTFRDWYESLSDEDKAKTSIGKKRMKFLADGGDWDRLIDYQNNRAVTYRQASNPDSMPTAHPNIKPFDKNRFVTGEQAHRAAKPLVPLDPFEREGIEKYCGTSYSRLNEALRNNRLDMTSANGGIEDSEREALLLHRDQLRAAFEKAETRSGMVVYRGLDAGKIVDNLVIGGTFTEKGFISTSSSFDVAFDYIREDAAVPCLFKINVGKGAKALSLRPYSHLPRDEEILLKNGTTFEVKDSFPLGNFTLYELEVKR